MWQGGSCVAPFLLVLCLAVAIVPSPDKPYDWRIILTLWDNCSEGFNKLTGALFHHSDEYGRIGFTDEGGFLGEVGDGDENVMKLQCGNLCGDRIYLSGKIFDTFDGRQWTAEDQTEGVYRMMDTLELKCAAEKFDPHYTSDYFQNTEVTLEYRMHNTRYMFMPTKAALDNVQIKAFIFSEKNESVMADEKLGYATKYTIPFYRVNDNTELYRTMLAEAGKITEWDWTKSLRGVSQSKKPEFNFDSYLKYREGIYRDYLSEITLSGEVQDNLSQLFEGCGSDIEKMDRLRAWLQSFEYNMAPGKIPEEIDTPQKYLDYFILQKREGFCVHFATAFTLLARSQGLPARYVQGYSVPTRSNDTVMVKSNMAHAWSEVYFKNVGWVVFDPTPGSEGVRPWALSDREDEGENEKVNYHNTPETVNVDIKDKVIAEETKPEKKKFNIRLILLPIAGVILFSIIFFIINGVLSKIGYRRLDNRGKVQNLCQKNLKYLAKLGYRIRQGETLAEYRERLSKEYGEEITDFIGCYEIISYSNKEVGQDMVEVVELSNREICIRLRKNRIWYRLISRV